DGDGREDPRRARLRMAGPVVAIRSRRSRLAAFLACALILGAPAGFLAAGAGELRGRLDAFWKPQPSEFDRRWLALGKAALLFLAAGAALLLARQGRRRAALEGQPARGADQATSADG